MDAEETTERLLGYWRSGCRASGDRLLRRYLPLLRGYFARRTAGDVDELVQRTLLACIQGVDRFEGRSSFKSYLFGIAHHQLLMSLRAEHVMQLSPLLASGADDSPSKLAALRQEQSILIRALVGVEARFLQVLKLFYWSQLSLEQISEELGVPVGTVKSRLARGRAMLKANVLGMQLRPEVRDDALRELVRWLESRRGPAKPEPGR
jgi:RNA polymerase sigma-70 factor, ECF subfamily